jgi:hypothetical protein
MIYICLWSVNSFSDGHQHAHILVQLYIIYRGCIYIADKQSMGYQIILIDARPDHWCQTAGLEIMSYTLADTCSSHHSPARMLALFDWAIISLADLSLLS